MATTGSEAHGADHYLEAVYELNEEGVRVQQARIAERLGVSRAAVSEQVGRLSRLKLVEVSRDRTIALTQKGRRLAEDAVRRHRMAERFLTDILKMPWYRAHEEAERIQGALTGEIEVRILAMLGGPATCPHGNPIPGTGASLPTDLRPLDSFEPGDRVVLHRLLEDVELHTETLRYFEEHGLMPGNAINVVAVAPDGTMTLEVGGVASTLGPELADNLFVRAVSKKRIRGRGIARG